MRNFLGIKGDNTLEKNSLNAIALSCRTCYWGPIIGLRLHGLDPIFKGGLRISTWFRIRETYDTIEILDGVIGFPYTSEMFSRGRYDKQNNYVQFSE